MNAVVMSPRASRTGALTLAVTLFGLSASCSRDREEEVPAESGSAQTGAGESEDQTTREAAELEPDPGTEQEALLPGDMVLIELRRLATLNCGCVDFASSFPDTETCVETLAMPVEFRTCIQEVGNDTSGSGADYANCYAGVLSAQVECTAAAACDMPVVDECEMTASAQNIECQSIAGDIRQVFEACLIREGAEF